MKILGINLTTVFVTVSWEYYFYLISFVLQHAVPMLMCSHISIQTTPGATMKLVIQGLIVVAKHRHAREIHSENRNIGVTNIQIIYAKGL